MSTSVMSSSSLLLLSHLFVSAISAIATAAFSFFHSLMSCHISLSHSLQTFPFLFPVMVSSPFYCDVTVSDPGFDWTHSLYPVMMYALH